MPLSKNSLKSTLLVFLFPKDLITCTLLKTGAPRKPLHYSFPL